MLIKTTVMLKDKNSLSSIATISHEDIKTWAEARKARPTRMRRFEEEPLEKRLRFRFPDEEYPDEEDLSWQEFFDIFDRDRLEFYFEDVADEAVEQGNVYQFKPRKV
jgi:hypothetical protein